MWAVFITASVCSGQFTGRRQFLHIPKWMNSSLYGNQEHEADMPSQPMWWGRFQLLCVNISIVNFLCQKLIKRMEKSLCQAVTIFVVYQYSIWYVRKIAFLVSFGATWKILFAQDSVCSDNAAILPALWSAEMCSWLASWPYTGEAVDRSPHLVVLHFSVDRREQSWWLSQYLCYEG